MSFTMISSCPWCGAPIYAPSVWHGITPPPATYSCSCVPQPKVVTTTTLKINDYPVSTGQYPADMSKALDSMAKAFEKENILHPDPPTIESLSAKVEEIESMLKKVLKAVETKETKKVKKQQKLLND